MSSFNEENINRETDGRFGEKLNSAPSVTLAYRSDDIVGYTYKAANYPPEKILAALGVADVVSEESIDERLAALAAERGIDRDDEYSFDSDDFPKAVHEAQVSTADYAWLGREYFEGFDGQPLTDDEALDEFADGLGIPTSDVNKLWEGTDYTKPASHNLTVIDNNARAHGIDLEKLGYPLPVRRNGPDGD